MADYLVRRASGPVFLNASFKDDPQWKNAELLRVDHLLDAEKKDFISKVSLKLLYDDANIYGLFQVEDRYVRAVRSGFQQDRQSPVLETLEMVVRYERPVDGGVVLRTSALHDVCNVRQRERIAQRLLGDDVDNAAYGARTE